MTYTHISTFDLYKHLNIWLTHTSQHLTYTNISTFDLYTHLNIWLIHTSQHLTYTDISTFDLHKHLNVWLTQTAQRLTYTKISTFDLHKQLNVWLIQTSQHLTCSRISTFDLYKHLNIWLTQTAQRLTYTNISTFDLYKHLNIWLTQTSQHLTYTNISTFDLYKDLNIWLTQRSQHLTYFDPPPYFEAEYCLFCGRRRVAVARYRMICLVLIQTSQHLTYTNSSTFDLHKHLNIWLVQTSQHLTYTNISTFDLYKHLNIWLIIHIGNDIVIKNNKGNGFSHNIPLKTQLCSLPWPWTLKVNGIHLIFMGDICRKFVQNPHNCLVHGIHNLISISTKCGLNLWPLGIQKFTLNLQNSRVATINTYLGHIAPPSPRPTFLLAYPQNYPKILGFRSCWNILSKLNLAPVNFHNRKCLAMKLILYTYKFKYCHIMRYHSNL